MPRSTIVKYPGDFLVRNGAASLRLALYRIVLTTAVPRLSWMFELQHLHALSCTYIPPCHFEYACIHQVPTQEKTIKPWSGNSSRRLFEPVQKRNQQALLFSTEVLASKYYQCLCSSRQRILRHTKTSISRQTNAAAGARTIWAYAGYLQSRTCCPRFSSITLPTQASCQKYAKKIKNTQMRSS